MNAPPAGGFDPTRDQRRQLAVEVQAEGLQVAQRLQHRVEVERRQLQAVTQQRVIEEDPLRHTELHRELEQLVEPVKIDFGQRALHLDANAVPMEVQDRLPELVVLSGRQAPLLGQVVADVELEQVLVLDEQVAEQIVVPAQEQPVRLQLGGDRPRHAVAQHLGEIAVQRRLAAGEGHALETEWNRLVDRSRHQLRIEVVGADEPVGGVAVLAVQVALRDQTDVKVRQRRQLRLCLWAAHGDSPCRDTALSGSESSRASTTPNIACRSSALGKSTRPPSPPARDSQIE